MDNLQRLTQHAMQARFMQAQIESLCVARLHIEDDAAINEQIDGLKTMLQFELDAIKHIAGSL